MTPARLTQGPVGRGLLNLTAPMILGISSSLIAAVFEMYLLGLIGTNELAAYSFTFPVIGALTSVGLGISIGLSSVLARSVGAGNQTQISRLATGGALLTTVLMLALTLVGLLTVTPLFTLMGANESTLPLIQDYMTIWYLGLVFFTLPFTGSNALRATGDARISGTIMVAGSIMQMILDPLLILGLLGFPKLGITGAAVATLISRLVLCGLTFYVLVYQKQLIVLARTSFENILDSWNQILKVGIPAIATNLIGPVSNFLIVSMLAGFGKEAVAGFGIASRLEAMSIIPLFALSASIGPYVGQNWGANRRDRASLAMKYAFGWSMLWGLLIALLFVFFRVPVSSYFETDETVIQYASMYLLIVPFSYGAWGVLMMASATFNSLGKPLSSTAMSVLRMFIIYVPLAYVGQLYWGAMGIFAAACLSNLIMGCIAFNWNRRTFVPILENLRAP